MYANYMYNLQLYTNMLQTWMHLHYARVAVALAFTVCYSQREAVLP